MADNTTLPGTGDVISADDVGGVKFQNVKLDLGGNGVTAPLSPTNPLPIYDAGPRAVLHRGSASSFRIPGRAGTAGQKLLSIHNATGSTVVVRLEKVVIDAIETVIKAITVLPPIIRLYKVTVLPSNGTALTKVSRDSGLSASSGSVTVLQDASADGTSSGTALTATLPAATVITQEFAPRFITAAGYEMADRIEFLLDQDEVVLRALEGVVLMLDYTLATQNPTTDAYIASVHWNEALT